MVEPVEPHQNLIRHRHIACWIKMPTDTHTHTHKHTNTHTKCVIIIAFPRQQRLREGASILRLYLRCLSCHKW